mgnify:CR=1 FL=1
MRTTSELPIDLANPINWLHPQAKAMLGFWKYVPGLAGGLYLHDLTNPGSNGRHGQLTNGPTWSGALGRSGGYGCLSYAGASDYVPIPSSLFGGLSGSIASVLMWIRPSSVGAYETLFDAGTSSTTRQLSAFLGGAANRLFVAVAGSAGNEAVLSDSWVVNEWQHLGIKSDGTTVTVYRNGENIGTIASAVGAGFTAGEWQIHGNPTTGGANYNGQSDEIIVSSHALPDSEFAAFYELSRRSFPGLINRLRMPLSAAAAGARQSTLSLMGVG